MLSIILAARNICSVAIESGILLIPGYIGGFLKPFQPILLRSLVGSLPHARCPLPADPELKGVRVVEALLCSLNNFLFKRHIELF